MTNVTLQNFSISHYTGDQSNPAEYLFLGYAKGDIVFEDLHGPGLDGRVSIKDMPVKAFFNADKEGVVTRSLLVGLPGKLVPARDGKDAYFVQTVGLDNETYQTFQRLARETPEVFSAFRVVYAQNIAEHEEARASA